MSSSDRGSVGPGRSAYPIDTSVAHPARRYNYWLGGKDHFAADRASGDEIAAAFPTVRLAALENRAFMRRAVTVLARELGIRQFLDIGTGIPAPGNTHEVAQRIAPESRVVYVDNDPVVMSHARALLTSTTPGAAAYIEADLRDHMTILEHPYLRSTLDLHEPVALMLVAILHFIPDSEDPYGIVAKFVGALAPGSYLVLSHATGDYSVREVVGRFTAPRGIYVRTREEVARFFTGMQLVPPGVEPVVNWRGEDEPPPRPSPVESPVYGGVGLLT